MNPDGGAPLSPAERPFPKALTPTERRIVELVCRGLTNPQIAAELFVEPTTVRWHLKNVFRKLGVRTRTELVSKRLAGPGYRADAGQTG